MQLPCHFIFISSHGSDFHFHFHSPRKVMEQAQTEFYASDVKLGCPGPRLPQEASGCSQRMYLHVLSEQCQSSDRSKLASVVFLHRSSVNKAAPERSAWRFLLVIWAAMPTWGSGFTLILPLQHYLCLPFCFQSCLGLHTTEVHISPTHASFPFSLHL